MARAERRFQSCAQFVVHVSETAHISPLRHDSYYSRPTTETQYFPTAGRQRVTLHRICIIASKIKVRCTRATKNTFRPGFTKCTRTTIHSKRFKLRHAFYGDPRFIGPRVHSCCIPGSGAKMHQARDYGDHLEFGREQADGALVQPSDETAAGRLVGRVREDQRRHLQKTRPRSRTGHKFNGQSVVYDMRL